MAGRNEQQVVAFVDGIPAWDVSEGEWRPLTHRPSGSAEFFIGGCSQPVSVVNGGAAVSQEEVGLVARTNSRTARPAAAAATQGGTAAASSEVLPTMGGVFPDLTADVDGTVRVPAGDFRVMRMYANAMAANGGRAKREETLAAAVAEGRLARDEVPVVRAQYNQDPRGTTQMLKARAAGSVAQAPAATAAPTAPAAPVAPAAAPAPPASLTRAMAGVPGHAKGSTFGSSPTEVRLTTERGPRGRVVGEGEVRRS